MERLTIPDEKIPGGVRRAIIDTRAVREEAMTLYWALKKYEDTGLTPNEVEQLKGSQRWIPVEERLPEPGEAVWATVKHSEWISDYDAGWPPEEKKTYHPESSGVYRAEYIGGENWRYADDYNEWIYCDAVEKEKGDLGYIYDTVTAWMPLPKPYRKES